MSSSTPRAPSRPTIDRRTWVLAGGAAALLAAGGTGLVVVNRRADPGARAELQRDHAPALGDADARVHIVEFIDPACETCAAFYPLVKQLMAEHAGRLRLSMRHVPFHPGVDEVVRMLEASRAQDAYWRTLESLLAMQELWVINHRAQPDVARRIVASLGLDMARLQADSGSEAVAQRMRVDAADATALGVEKTPEYFVNGRQMPSFGRVQLQTLVRDELRRTS